MVRGIKTSAKNIFDFLKNKNLQGFQIKVSDRDDLGNIVWSDWLDISDCRLIDDRCSPDGNFIKVGTVQGDMIGFYDKTSHAFFRKKPA